MKYFTVFLSASALFLCACSGPFDPHGVPATTTQIPAGMKHDSVREAIVLGITKAKRWNVIASDAHSFVVSKSGEAEYRARITYDDARIEVIQCGGKKNVTDWLQDLGSQINLALETRKSVGLTDGGAFVPSAIPVSRIKVSASTNWDVVQGAIVSTVDESRRRVNVVRTQGAGTAKSREVAFGDASDRGYNSISEGNSESRSFDEEANDSAWDVSSISDDTVEIVSQGSVAQFKFTKGYLEARQLNGKFDMSGPLRRLTTRIARKLNSAK